MWVGFLIGFVAGSVFGIISMTLCVASRRSEDADNKRRISEDSR